MCAGCDRYKGVPHGHKQKLDREICLQEADPSGCRTLWISDGVEVGANSSTGYTVTLISGDDKH
jgi:hypothetical protein